MLTCILQLRCLPSSPGYRSGVLARTEAVSSPGYRNGILARIQKRYGGRCRERRPSRPRAASRFASRPWRPVEAEGDPGGAAGRGFAARPWRPVPSGRPPSPLRAPLRVHPGCAPKNVAPCALRRAEGHGGRRGVETERGASVGAVRLSMTRAIVILSRSEAEAKDLLFLARSRG